MIVPDKMVCPNSILLSMAVQAVERGQKAKIPVRGHSMDPFICGKKDCVELYPLGHYQIGDIVLAEVAKGKYLLHRILRFEGDDGVVLMGDGNVGSTEFCHRRNLKAKALVVVKKNGKRRRLDSFPMKTAGAVWRSLLPCRSFLLRGFRKFCR